MFPTVRKCATWSVQTTLFLPIVTNCRKIQVPIGQSRADTGEIAIPHIDIHLPSLDNDPTFVTMSEWRESDASPALRPAWTGFRASIERGSMATADPTDAPAGGFRLKFHPRMLGTASPVFPRIRD